MQINDLLTLYPKAEKKSVPAFQETVVSLPLEDGYLWIDKQDLSEKEIALLTLVFQPTDTKPKIQEHPWYQILFQQVPVTEDGYYRVLQMQLQTKSDFLAKEWRENIEEMFPHAVDFFFLTKEQVILVEQSSKNALQQDELSGIFLTLDADFDTSTKIFVGSFTYSKEDLYELFQEERTIFEEELPLVKEKNVFSLADVALHYFTKKSMKHSALIKSYKRQLDIDVEMAEIIQTLWHNQGNISSTAKELFMHRNTLQYRLERFQETTGLNIKNTDELILCYLLLL